MTPTRSWQVLSYGLSDIGLVRQKNEDAWDRDLSCHLYVLADGIGGRQAGEVASQRAVQRLCDIISQHPHLPQLNHPDGVCDLLWHSIQQVNREIYEIAQQNEFLKGMGTTLCALLIHEQHIYTAHLGDSRIYLLRQSQISCMTQDHKPPQAVGNPHLISRALGVRAIAEPTIAWCPAEPEDLFLLCSDGLSNSLDDEQIEGILQQPDSLKQRCHHLIEQAKNEGGSDNITALLVHLGVEELDPLKPACSCELPSYGSHLLRQ